MAVNFMPPLMRTAAPVNWPLELEVGVEAGPVGVLPLATGLVAKLGVGVGTPETPAAADVPETAGAGAEAPPEAGLEAGTGAAAPDGTPAADSLADGAGTAPEGAPAAGAVDAGAGAGAGAPEEAPAAGALETGAGAGVLYAGTGVADSVTGQTVVPMEMVSVVT